MSLDFSLSDSLCKTDDINWRVTAGDKGERGRKVVAKPLFHVKHNNNTINTKHDLTHTKSHASKTHTHTHSH